MADDKWCYGDAIEVERFVGLDDPFIEREKPEYPRAIIHDRGGGEYRRDMLDAVEIPESHEVIVMPVGPDYRVDVRGSVPQQLLAKIRRGIYQQVKAFVLNEKRGSQAHCAGCFCVSTLGACAPDLWRTDCIAGPEKGNSHNYNQFRCRIASRFFTM